MFRFPRYLTAAAAALLITACSEKIEPGGVNEPPRPIVAAKTARAASLSRPETLEVVGTVKADLSSTLSAKILGTVRKVHTAEGRMVKAGELLVSIDPESADAGSQKARAARAEALGGEAEAASALASARAQYGLAEATFKRYERLYAAGLVSLQEFDQMKAGMTSAKAAVGQAEAAVTAAARRVDQASAGMTEARVNVKDTRILAPYDGVVSQKFVSDGDLAAPGAPLLSVESLSGLRADFDVPESLGRLPRPGDRIYVTVAGASAGPFTATVRVLLPAADEKTRTLTLEVDLPRIAGLRSGMFARAALPLGDAPVIEIPETAVRSEGQVDGFFLVDEKGVARFRILRLGKSGGGKVAVLSGLAPGERYVVSPPLSLADGDRVEEAP